MLTLTIALFVLSVDGAILWMVSRGASAELALLAGATVLTNLLVGIRIGYDAARAYFQDVARLNRFLCDQNEQLAMSNRELLERLGDSIGDSPPPEEEQIAEPSHQRSREHRKGA